MSDIPSQTVETLYASAREILLRRGEWRFDSHQAEIAIPRLGTILVRDYLSSNHEDFDNSCYQASIRKLLEHGRSFIDVQRPDAEGYLFLRPSELNPNPVYSEVLIHLGLDPTRTDRVILRDNYLVRSMADIAVLQEILA